MKKLLVFRPGIGPIEDEVLEYLEETEIIRRGHYVDAGAQDVHCTYTDDKIAQYRSDWTVVFKDDEVYDQWHIAVHPECYRAGLVLEPYRREGAMTLTAVLYKERYTVLIYRITKVIAALLAEHLTAILTSYREGIYRHAVATEIFDPLVLQSQEAIRADSAGGD